MKRAFDVVCSAIGLVLLAPFFALAGIIIKLDSSGPVFFRQERIGRGFRPFIIYKFRTMTHGSSSGGPLITVGGDGRITGVGGFLRKTKIDELPQLINVLKGEMSLVGPRPEVDKYVRLFRNDYERLLKVRPGITDPASICYADEEEVLSASSDWEEAYVKKVLPEKIKLSMGYVDHHNVFIDAGIIIKTLFRRRTG